MTPALKGQRSEYSGHIDTCLKVSTTARSNVLEARVLAILHERWVPRMRTAEAETSLSRIATTEEMWIRH